MLFADHLLVFVFDRSHHCDLVGLFFLHEVRRELSLPFFFKQLEVVFLAGCLIVLFLADQGSLGLSFLPSRRDFFVDFLHE